MATAGAGGQGGSNDTGGGGTGGTGGTPNDVALDAQNVSITTGGYASPGIVVTSQGGSGGKGGTGETFDVALLEVDVARGPAMISAPSSEAPAVRAPAAPCR